MTGSVAPNLRVVRGTDPFAEIARLEAENKQLRERVAMPKVRPVSEGDALRLCRLFFADGWKQFNGSERRKTAARMFAALNTINAVPEDPE